MIKRIEERNKGKIEIDLTGPQGNVFYLLGIAEKLAHKLDKDSEDILNRMQSSDYENAVNVLEKEFGDYIILWR